MSEVTVYRVLQYMSKKVNVICVDGIHVCTAIGSKTTSDIKDGRINKLGGLI